MKTNLTALSRCVKLVNMCKCLFLKAVAVILKSVGTNISLVFAVPPGGARCVCYEKHTISPEVRIHTLRY